MLNITQRKHSIDVIRRMSRAVLKHTLEVIKN